MSSANAHVPDHGNTKIWIWVPAILIAAFYFWSAGGWQARWFSPNPEGYYNLQTAGFLQGHLHAAVDPHPALLALPDPYDPTANAPYRIHDMTLWSGHYYLYFGVAPILLLFAPFRMLTGQYLVEPIAVAFFVSIGLFFAVAAMERVRSRWHSGGPRWLATVMVGLLGFGGATMFLTQAPQFYQVPISCAYALLMGSFYGVARLMTSAVGHGKRWLLVAGILFGLTQAARPNYVLAMPLLALPLWWWLRREGIPLRAWRAALVPAVLVFGPIAAVGVGLLIYNWARFGNPFEFGMRYQLAGQSFVNFTALHLKYLWPHAVDYLWQQIWWQPSFPYLESRPEAPFGFFRCSPVLVFGLAAFWPSRSAEGGRHWGPVVFAALLAGVATANLVMNSLFFFEPMLRYVADFAPSFVLLTVVGALRIAHEPRLRLGSAVSIGVLTLVTIGVGLAVFVQRLPVPRRPDRLGKVMDPVVARVGQWLGWEYGARVFEVELPIAPKAPIEPLFQTGYSPERRDWLQIHYLPEGRAQLGLFHAGLGEVLGRTFAVPVDRKLRVEVHCGAFLPAPTHPVFDGWLPHEITSATRKLEVKVNDAPVLSASLICYPSRPWDLKLGAIGIKSDERPRFSGTIRWVATKPIVRESVPPRTKSVTGVLELTVQLPSGGHGFDPLLSAGEVGRGETLFLVYGPNHTVQFGLDSWGLGAVHSKWVKYDPTEKQQIVVWLGAWQVAPNSSNDSPLQRRFYLALNGEVLIDQQRTFHPGQGISTALGWNRLNSGSAGPEFSGRILDAQERDVSILPPAAIEGGYGTVDLDVRLSNRVAQAEPLVATGVNGAGDIVFVKYLDGQHVQFGIDHWGTGGTLSVPVAVDFSQLHRVEISMGSLHAPGASSWRRRLLLRLDGVTLLDQAMDFHPSTPGQIRIGGNSIGASTCGERFSGQIVNMRRSLNLEE